MPRTPASVLAAMNGRLVGSAPLRPIGDACAAYAGWLATAWPSLDEQTQSLLIDVGATLYAVAKERGHSPGGIRSGIEALLAPLKLR
jgi:hypothetical protein